jgi:CheY-like chemotaxis protein
MTKILKILIIEDDSKCISQLEEWLPADFQGIFVKSVGRATELLERDNCRDNSHVYAGIVLDLDLQQQLATEADQDFSGSTIIKAIIRYLSADIPVLVFSRTLKRVIHMEDKLSDEGFIVTKIPMDQMDKDLVLRWLGGVRANWSDLF